MLLIDSTVYVDWFRRRVEPRDKIEPWVRARAIATCGVIRAEVVRGIVHPGQKAIIEELFDVLEEIPTDHALWADAAELAWSLDRKGTVLPLTDIVIAACALRSKAILITADSHFAQIPGLVIRPEVPKFA